MMHTEFPRLYVEQPEMPRLVLTMHFVARRWPFGPCTVVRDVRLDGVPGKGDYVIPADWHKEIDAEWIAREVLWLAKCRNDGDVPARFAREVLAKLPRDGWELSQAEVEAWVATHAPEDPPVAKEVPPPFEERVKAMLRRLGMLDEEGPADAAAPPLALPDRERGEFPDDEPGADPTPTP